MDGENDTSKNMIKRMATVLVSIILTALLLFVSAGTFNWFFAWIYNVLTILIIMCNAFFLKPELIAERGKKKENAEKWDRVVSGLIVLPWLGIYIVSGLDIRFKWSMEPGLWVHIIGIIFFVLGNALVTWAMATNTYFSTVVRIQEERKHTVVSGGPYGIVRHPGYLGMIVFYLFTPAILGSIRALIPAGLTVILYIIRTALEDRTLKEKLGGYKEYAEKVRYRLIPGVW
jgi:protein-S-isoprenylcysteine O-methyltransferase Ste14